MGVLTLVRLQQELRYRLRYVDLLTNPDVRPPFIVRSKVSTPATREHNHKHAQQTDRHNRYMSVCCAVVATINAPKVINYIRTFLTSRRFMEVETPTLWPSVGPWPILP